MLRFCDISLREFWHHYKFMGLRDILLNLWESQNLILIFRGHYIIRKYLHSWLNTQRRGHVITPLNAKWHVSGGRTGLDYDKNKKQRKVCVRECSSFEKLKVLLHWMIIPTTFCQRNSSYKQCSHFTVRDLRRDTQRHWQSFSNGLFFSALRSTNCT